MSLAVLCPGQGGQHGAMFEVFDDDPHAAALLGQAGDAAGFDLVAAVRSTSDPASMFANAVAQPLICAHQVIAWSLLSPRLAAIGVAPTLFAGYSVGELGAHGCVGRLSFDDTIALANDRAAAMDAASGADDGLAAIRGLTRGAIDALCATHRAFIAIVNGDDHFIVGGTGPSLDGVATAAVARGGSAQRLPVGIAAHTPLLAAAVGPFRERLAHARWRDAAVPVLAGTDASLVYDAATAIDRLSQQVAATIDWAGCMDGLKERGITACIELGPGNALSRMLHDRHRDLDARSVADFRSIAAVSAWIARVSG